MLGFICTRRIHVPCPGQRHGANGHLRAEYESVLLLRPLSSRPRVNVLCVTVRTLMSIDGSLISSLVSHYKLTLPLNSTKSASRLSPRITITRSPSRRSLARFSASSRTTQSR